MPDWARITTGVRSTRLPPPGQWIIYYQELQNNYSHSTPAFSGIAGITRCARSCPRGPPGSRVSLAIPLAAKPRREIVSSQSPTKPGGQERTPAGAPGESPRPGRRQPDVDLPGFQAVKAASQWNALVLARHPPSSITDAHQRRPQHASAAAPASTPALRSLLASQAQIASGLLSHPTPDGLVAVEVRAVARQVHQP